MKTLKDDVSQRIVDAARDEFLLSGYARASMRTIAKHAGMTVGNIYLYFTGKDQLFEALVEEPVRHLREMMQLSNTSDETLRWLADVLHSVFIQNRVEFLILITRSEGSRYENFKEMIVDFARSRFTELYGRGENGGLYSALAVALIEGLLDIFNRYQGDGVQLTRDLIQFLNYMLGGLTACQGEEAAPCKP